MHILCTKLAFWPQSGCEQSELLTDLHAHRWGRVIFFKMNNTGCFVVIHSDKNCRVELIRNLVLR